jgi:hypothetical protein
MATEDEGGREGIIRVGQVSGSKWTVSIDDDPTPISEHRTRSEAEAAARIHAETYGYPEILVYDHDGLEETMIIEELEPRPDETGGEPAR